MSFLAKFWDSDIYGTASIFSQPWAIDQRCTLIKRYAHNSVELPSNSVVGKREGSEIHLTLKYPFLSPKPREPDLDSIRTDRDGSKEAMTMESTKDKEESKRMNQGRQPETTALLFMIQGFFATFICCWVTLFSFHTFMVKVKLNFLNWALTKNVE